MGLETLRNLFTQLFSEPICSDRLIIVWHSGEPLTAGIDFYRRAFDLIDQLAKENQTSLNYSHTFQTNGTLLTDEWCSFIADRKVGIGLSIDGPEFIHDRFRTTRTGAATFQRVYAALQKLQANRIPFNVISVITAFSLDHPAKLFEFFQSNKVPFVGFNIDELEGGHTTSSYFEVADAAAKFERFFEVMYDLTSADNCKLQIREFEIIKSHLLGKKNLEENLQRQPLSVLSVDHLGNFCTFSPELLPMSSPQYGNFIMGNVNADAISKISENSTFKSVYQDIEAGAAKCKEQCEYYEICGGDAPSNKYFENGTFDSTETVFCKLIRKRLTDLVLRKMEGCLPAQPAKAM